MKQLLVRVAFLATLCLAPGAMATTGGDRPDGLTPEPFGPSPQVQDALTARVKVITFEKLTVTEVCQVRPARLLAVPDEQRYREDTLRLVARDLGCPASR
jgi:hypothetical protein